MVYARAPCPRRAGRRYRPPGILISLGAGQSSPTRSFAGYLFWASYVLGYVAFAAGLWRFGSVPASTGAARPARQSFLCFAAGHGWLLLCVLLVLWPDPALYLGSLVWGLFALWPIALLALSGISLGLLARALGAVFRSLGETPPA